MSDLARGTSAIEAAGTIETFAEGGAVTCGAPSVNPPALGAPQADDPGTDFLEVFGLSLFEPTREKALARYRAWAADPFVTILAHRAAPEAGGLAGPGAGRIDGCIAYRRDGDSLELLNIGTAPAVRGTGLGRRLIEAAIGREGPASVRLETDNDAVGFYRSCGFSVTSLGEKYPGIERFGCRRAGA
jgi:ribosomal protein S18 acetylase RimI-like enzyme